MYESITHNRKRKAGALDCHSLKTENDEDYDHVYRDLSYQPNRQEN